MDDILGNLALAITPVLFSLLLYFAHRLVGQVDKLDERSINLTKELAPLGDLLISMRSLKEDFARMKLDVETALVAARQVRLLQEECAILKRNQETIFKKIDKLSDDLSDFSYVISDFRKTKF